MNRKQFATLLGLLIVLGGAGLVINHNRKAGSSAGEQGGGKKLLGDKFDVNGVAHITIKGGTNELNLVRKNDLWRVRERNDYPANFSEISGFLIKAAGLKVVQSEQVGASQLPRLQLAPGQGTNSGVAVEFKDKDDKTVQALTLGKMHMRKAPQQQSQFGDSEGFPD